MSDLTGADVEELESLVELTRLSGWRYIKNIFTKHRIHCEERTKKHLKQHEDRKAGEWLARSEESNVLLLLIQTRKQELSDKTKGE